MGTYALFDLTFGTETWAEGEAVYTNPFSDHIIGSTTYRVLSNAVVNSVPFSIGGELGSTWGSASYTNPVNTLALTPTLVISTLNSSSPPLSQSNDTPNWIPNGLGGFSSSLGGTILYFTPAFSKSVYVKDGSVLPNYISNVGVPLQSTIVSHTYPSQTHTASISFPEYVWVKLPAHENQNIHFSVSDATEVQESNGAFATFTVDLSTPLTYSTEVTFSTKDGTAIAGQDYVAQSGKLTFSPGETSKQIFVEINDDILTEENENFGVNLDATSSSDGAAPTIQRETGNAVIQSDDSEFSISTNQVIIQEGDSGITEVTFDVKRLGDVSKRASIFWEPANASAIADFRRPGEANVFDYDLIDPNVNRIVFEPGETTKTITVGVYGDTMPENDEALVIRITSDKYQITTDTSVIDIINDDGIYTAESIANWALSQQTKNARSGGLNLTRSGNASLDPTQITEEAWFFINENRHYDGEDLVLRNAEYYLYGVNVTMNDPLWGISGIALWVFGIGYVSLKYLGVGYRENSDNPNSDPGGLDYFIQGVSDALNLQLYSDEQVRTIFEQKDLRSIVPPSVVPPLGSVDPNLTGTNGSDTLTGGPEANIMAGGAGRDTLWGGANADTFVFTKGTSGIKATTADTIMDWEVIDQIDMTIRGNKKNYEEDDTTAASISKAAAYAEKTFTDKNTTHVFLYNKKKDTGYLLSDLDNNDKYETGVILKGAGASSSFSHTDII